MQQERADTERIDSLLASWRQGDRQALPRLLALEAPWLRALITPQLGGVARRLDDTEDVLQEAALRLQRLETCPEIDSRRSLRAYLARVVEHVLIDRHRLGRRQRRDRAREVPLGVDTAGGEPAGEQDGPCTEADRHDKGGWIHRSLEQLSPQERAPLELWSQGHSFVEIAALLEITPDAARMKRNRALAKLVGMRRRMGRD